MFKLYSGQKRRTLDRQETLANSVFFSVHEGIRTSDPTLRRRRQGISNYAVWYYLILYKY